MKFISENVWVWAGTGLVLITLSGRTRELGIALSVSAVVAHAISTYMTKDDEI